MQPVSSSLYPLLHNNTELGEVVHTWNVNNSIVRLIRNQNTLECETITNGNTYTAPLTIPTSDSIDQMVSYLKVCRVIVDENGVPSFLSNYQTWNVENKSVHLLRGIEDLIWNIFCTVTNKSECFNLKDSTIPSIRCHAETIALIEKIKEHSLNRSYINFLKDDFKVVRILDNETIEKERRDLKIDKYMVKLDRYINNPYVDRAGSFQPQNTLVTSGMAASGVGAIYLASNAIGATAGAASSFFGGGVLGTIAGGFAGYVTGGVALAAGGIPLGVALVGYHLLRDRPDLKQKENLLQARSQILSPEKPLFVEIEPISEPSQIDNRLQVSKFIWAVTLVMHGGSTGDHTQIIVEGINNGFYDAKSRRIGMEKPIAIGEKFIHLAHYQPRIESVLFPSEKLTFTKRTEIWMKSSEKIIPMFQQIEKEMALQEERLAQDKDLPIALFGCDSLISGGSHSCFTWAREKIHMLGIDLGESKIGFIATIPRTYMKTQKEWKKLPVILQI